MLISLVKTSDWPWWLISLCSCGQFHFFPTLGRDERKEILPPCFGVFIQSSAVVTVFRRGRGMLICGEFQLMFMSGEPDKREESNRKI